MKMLRQVTKLILVIICLLLLTACGKEDKVNYQQGLPSENNPALTEFLQDHILGYGSIFLFEEGDTFTYAIRNMNENENTINYFQYTSSEFNQYANRIFSTEDHAHVLHELFNGKENLQETINHQEDERLPDVTLEEGNVLSIKTSQNETSFSISDNLEKDIDEELLMNIYRTNEEGFILELENETTGELYYFFALHDLSKMDVFQDTALDNAIEQEELVPYYSLLEKVNESLSVIDYQVVDTKTHQPFRTKVDDTFSEDYKYVYLNGEVEPLTEGTQKIQKVEDYIEGTKQNYAEFELNYDEIADELDFDSVGIGIAKIAYFDEDFIILSLQFDSAFVGTAGSTNVIVDLQEDKGNPAYYLVDLRLQ
ncbi:hypothetical protein KFZ56_04485 [Virgibacillus sp. NKC19-3]|uniref:hypothetical protein n=1 Tax=Virgibacillus saliphilus TaxID=2831674 RepID=UPI001C9B64FF|nr:hypothetical protein [Virgibacillus sp. NKC19-3]MBY7142363.1 hypothetical protein [Virgibacillus sp. NKC19-3]